MAFVIQTVVIEHPHGKASWSIISLGPCLAKFQGIKHGAQAGVLADSRFQGTPIRPLRRKSRFRLGNLLLTALFESGAIASARVPVSGLAQCQLDLLELIVLAVCHVAVFLA